jgi:hypothetical protein
LVTEGYQEDTSESETKGRDAFSVSIGSHFSLLKFATEPYSIVGLLHTRVNEKISNLFKKRKENSGIH